VNLVYGFDRKSSPLHNGEKYKLNISQRDFRVHARRLRECYLPSSLQKPGPTLKN